MANGEAKGAKIPTTFLDYLKALGPGIVVVLTWLGAGDLVDTAVAGSHYGYALMWALALALLVRYGLVNIIAKYSLCNTKGDTILQGFRRIHAQYPLVLGIGALLLGHFYNSYLVKGAGNALYQISGVGNVFIWSVIVVIAAVLLTGRGVYNLIENLMKVILALMVVALLGSAIAVGPDYGAIARGTFAFAVPEDAGGGFGVMVIVVSLIGAVAGSLSNLMYPYFLKDKGYITPAHRKAVNYDLLFGILMIIILDLAVWILGAEILHPKGISVESVDDMARMLGDVIGQIGTLLFYLGVLGATFSSVVGYGIGFPKLIVDAVFTSNPARAEKYNHDYTRDPIYRISNILIVIVPLIWAIPGMPGFIWLTIMVNAWQILLLPLVAIGLLILTNKSELLGKYKNGLLENLFMVFLIVLALWGTYQVVTGLVAKVSGL